MFQINEIFGTTFGNLRVENAYCDDNGKYFADFVCEQFFFKV